MSDSGWVTMPVSGRKKLAGSEREKVAMSARWPLGRWFLARRQWPAPPSQPATRLIYPSVWNTPSASKRFMRRKVLTG